jgi:hypothetical protein
VIVLVVVPAAHAVHIVPAAHSIRTAHAVVLAETVHVEPFAAHPLLGAEAARAAAEALVPHHPMRLDSKAVNRPLTMHPANFAQRGRRSRRAEGFA